MFDQLQLVARFNSLLPKLKQKVYVGYTNCCLLTHLISSNLMELNWGLLACTQSKTHGYIYLYIYRIIGVCTHHNSHACIGLGHCPTSYTNDVTLYTKPRHQAALRAKMVVSLSSFYLNFELLDLWSSPNLVYPFSKWPPNLTNYRQVVCLLQQRAQAFFGIARCIFLCVDGLHLISHVRLRPHNPSWCGTRKWFPFILITQRISTADFIYMNHESHLA